MNHPDVTPPIPDHELLRLIGRGSYGEVWLARNALGTYRAVKIVRRASFDSDRPYIREFSGIQRFEPVSRSHDGFVDVLQVGRNDAAGFFYYVMELADAVDAPAGELELEPDSYRPSTLASVLKSRTRLPVLEAIPIFTQLAAAIGHLHLRGLLHRDIKPGNVVFVGGIPKLADIGLVATAGESGTFVGTEGFIPPEGPGSVSADLYAFGKSMYETVTGRDRQECPALSLDPGDPQNNAALLELNAVLLKCCDPDPALRYRSAAEVQADLVLLQSGHSVRRLRSVERSLRFARRTGAVVAMVAVLAVVASIVAKEQTRRTRENLQKSEFLRRRAESAEKSARERLAESELSSARALNRSKLGNTRRATLAALTNAAAVLGPTVTIRSEAIMALARVDLEEVRRWPSPVTQGLYNEPQCFSPDLRLIARVEANRRVQLIDTATGTSAGWLTEPLPDVSQRVGPFTQDGKAIYLLEPPGRLCVLDLKTGSHLLRLELPDCLPFDYLRCFTAYGRELALSDREGHLRLTALSDGSSRTLQLPQFPGVWAFHPHRPVVITWAKEALRQLDLETGEVRLLPVPGGPTNFGWSPDGRWRWSGTEDLRLLFWDESKTNSEPIELRGLSGILTDATVLNEDQFAVVGSNEGVIELWSLLEQRVLSTFPVLPRSILATADGRRLGVADQRTGELLELSVAGRKVCRTTLIGPDPVRRGPNGLCFTRDGRHLIVDNDRTVSVLSYPECQVTAQLVPGHVRQVVETTAGDLVATDNEGWFRWRREPTSDGSLKFASIPTRSGLNPGNSLIWDGGQIVELPSSRGWRYRADENQSWTEIPATNDGAAISGADGRWIATLQTTGVRFWDARSGAHVITVHSPVVVAGIFSADGRRFIGASREGLHSWRLPDGRPDWTLPMPGVLRDTPSMSLSIDGALFAIQLDRTRVALVATSDGRLLANLEHPSDQTIGAIAFSPDSQTLAVACQTRFVQFWNLPELRAGLAELHLDW